MVLYVELYANMEVQSWDWALDYKLIMEKKIW